jgi:Na+/phosphate symporter
MNYHDLIQLYFERSNALQAYWTLYVVIVGGVLAFSSLRKEPATFTTAIVSVLFALFAFENLNAIQDTASQRFATLDAIKKFESGSAEVNGMRAAMEATLTPASHSSTRTTHLVSDVLTIAALWAMEMRRRKWRAAQLA